MFHFKSILNVYLYDKHPLTYYLSSDASSYHLCPIGTCMYSAFPPCSIPYRISYGFCGFLHRVRCVCCSFFRKASSNKSVEVQMYPGSSGKRVWQIELSCVPPSFTIRSSGTKWEVSHPLMNSHCSYWWLFHQVRVARGVVKASAFESVLFMNRDFSIHSEGCLGGK